MTGWKPIPRPDRCQKLMETVSPLTTAFAPVEVRFGNSEEGQDRSGCLPGITCGHRRLAEYGGGRDEDLVHDHCHAARRTAVWNADCWIRDWHLHRRSHHVAGEKGRAKRGLPLIAPSRHRTTCP